jgi:undecaprenyl pyrophosphate synthase
MKLKDKEKIKELQKELRKHTKKRHIKIELIFNRDILDPDFDHKIAYCEKIKKDHYKIVIFAFGWFKHLGHEFGHVMEDLLSEDKDVRLKGHGEIAYLFEDAIEAWQRKRIEEEDKSDEVDLKPDE